MNFFHKFFFINSRKQNLRLFNYFGIVWIFSCFQSLKFALCRIDLSKDLLAGFRHKGIQKSRSDTDTIHQIVQDGSQTRFLFFLFGKCPRHRLVDIFITAFKQGKDFRNGICHTKFVHFFCHFARCRIDNSFQFIIDRLGNTGIFNHSVKILIGHGNGTIYKISQCIGKVGIHAFYH